MALSRILWLLLVFNTFEIESLGPMKADWIQKAFDAHKQMMGDVASNAAGVAEKAANIGRENKKYPLEDLFDEGEGEGDGDGTPKRKPMVPPLRRTLDPLNIINKKDYDNNPFDNALEMRDSETQHSFQHPLDMISQNWILIGDAVATTNFARY